MVDKVALAKTGLKFAMGTQSKKSKKGGKGGKVKTPKPGDNPFYYADVVLDQDGRPKMDSHGRPVTRERRKDLNYYVNQLGIPEKDAKVLLKMKNRAMLMDGGRKVLGFRVPLGLSTVLTFCVPEIGDGVDGMISYMMVVRAGQISGGLGARNHAAMTLNVGRDFAIGTIPFAGAVIDMFYRANTRNSNMLEKILIERVKKAKLHPNASYESSLHDDSSQGHHSDEDIPHVGWRETGHTSVRKHSDHVSAKRSNTAPSRLVERERLDGRHIDGAFPEDTTPRSRQKSSRSKHGPHIGRSNTHFEERPSVQSKSRHEPAPVSSSGGRFVNLKDL